MGLKGQPGPGGTLGPLGEKGPEGNEVSSLTFLSLCCISYSNSSLVHAVTDCLLLQGEDGEFGIMGDSGPKGPKVSRKNTSSVWTQPTNTHTCRSESHLWSYATLNSLSSSNHFPVSLTVLSMKTPSPLEVYNNNKICTRKCCQHYTLII